MTAPTAGPWAGDTRQGRGVLARVWPFRGQWCWSAGVGMANGGGQCLTEQEARDAADAWLTARGVVLESGRTDAEEAVAILRGAGWAEAYVNGNGYLMYCAHDFAVSPDWVERPNGPHQQFRLSAVSRRGSLTLTDCARLIVETATREGWLPNPAATSDRADAFAVETATSHPEQRAVPMATRAEVEAAMEQACSRIEALAARVAALEARRVVSTLTTAPAPTPPTYDDPAAVLAWLSSTGPQVADDAGVSDADVRRWYAWTGHDRTGAAITRERIAAEIARLTALLTPAERDPRTDPRAGDVWWTQNRHDEIPTSWTVLEDDGDEPPRGVRVRWVEVGGMTAVSIMDPDGWRDFMVGATILRRAP